MAIEKYHWRDGFWFTRQKNGDVLIEKHTADDTAPEQAFDLAGKHPAVEATVLIPAKEWAAICAAMSLDGQGMFSKKDYMPAGMKPTDNLVNTVFQMLHSTPLEAMRVYSVCNYGASDQEP